MEKRRANTQIGFRGLRVSCIVGVREHERRREQDLLVDLSLDYDATAAAATDALDDAVDYSAIAELIAQQLVDGRYCLLERAGNAVAEAVMESEPRAQRIELTLRKPAAIADAECAFVKVQKTR